MHTYKRMRRQGMAVSQEAIRRQVVDRDGRPLDDMDPKSGQLPKCSTPGINPSSKPLTYNSDRRDLEDKHRTRSIPHRIGKCGRVPNLARLCRSPPRIWNDRWWTILRVLAAACEGRLGKQYERGNCLTTWHTLHAEKCLLRGR